MAIRRTFLFCMLCLPALGANGQPFASAPVYSLLSCTNGDLWVGSAVFGISLLRNGTNRNDTTANGFPEGAVLGLAQDRGGKFDIWSGPGTGPEIDLRIPGSIAYRKTASRSRFRRKGNHA